MNILFDFDGTICDSLDALLDSANPFMQTIGKPKLSKNDVHEKGLITILRENNIPTSLLPFIVLYVRYKLTSLIPHLKPFPTIADTIKTLSAAHTLGIVTSNSKRNVHKFLVNNNLEGYFDFVYSSINFLDKSARINNALVKHSLDSTETYFVGDETRDMKAAKLSEVKTIAVTWGIESKALLQKSYPDKVISTPQQLLKIIK